jgi:hypothetical protein
MYTLISDQIDWQHIKRPQNIEYHRVFDTKQQTGAYHFLHGVSVDHYEGLLVVSFALNEGNENTITEKLMVCYSADEGMTWSKPEMIGKPGGYANSHSVFLSHKGDLWCFGPRFKGLGTPPVTTKGHKTIHFVDLQLEAWRYNGSDWIGLGIVGDDIWPLGMPERMENGNYFIAGCDRHWYAAGAISHGENLTKWDKVSIDTDGEVFTEAGAWIQNNQVLMVLRNQSVMSHGKFHAAVTVSSDYGRSFSPCMLSNLPMATTKPFCGRLKDGRPYLVFNRSIEGKPYDRSQLVLGICEQGELRIDKLYAIDEGRPGPERRSALSYPYAKQINNKLYIAYSYESAPGLVGGNHNDAMLAAVDIGSL